MLYTRFLMKRATETKTLPRSLRRQRLAKLVLGIVTAGSMVLVGQSVQACDYCDSGPVGCDSCSGGAKTANPIFRTLDSLAGGIEAMMGFDKCGSCGSGGCDDASCDDACDAAMIQELSIPYPQAHAPVPAPAPAPFPIPSYAPPQTVQPYVAPAQPHVIAPAPIIHSAPRTVAPIQTAPRAVAPVPLTDMRMSEPTIVSPQSVPFEEMPSASEREQYQDYNPEISDSNALPMPPAEVPMDRMPTQEPELPIAPTPDVAPNAPVPAPVPNPADPTPQTFPDDDGGLFDSLEEPATGNPFGDDEVRLPEPYRSIRPSNFRKPSSPSTPVQPSNYRRLNPPVQLHSPQTRGGYTNSRTQHVANQQRPAVQQYSAGQRVSVDQMRLAAERQNYTQKRRLTDQQIAAIQHAKAAQQRKISQQYAQTRTAQHNQVTSRGSVQRASAQHTTRRTVNAHVSHQQVAAHQKQTVQRTAHQYTPHNHHATHNHAASQLKRAPQPKAAVPQVQRQVTGQRHSNASYSGYGHTTKRASAAASSSRRNAATYQPSSRRTVTTR